MFDRNSRYYGLAEATIEMIDRGGSTRGVSYVKRRFIPEPSAYPPSASHTVTQGERLDNIASRHLGDPTLFWHLVDGTDALDPDELTDHPGMVIDIRLPGMGIG